MNIKKTNELRPGDTIQLQHDDSCHQWVVDEAYPSQRNSKYCWLKLSTITARGVIHSSQELLPAIQLHQLIQST